MTDLRVKRAAGLSFYFKDRVDIDVGRLMRGAGPLKGVPVLYAASALTEDTQAIEPRDVEVMSQVSECEWTDADSIIEQCGVARARFLDYALWGLLVCNEPGPRFEELRQRDEQLREVRWNRQAQQIHFMSKWSDKLMDISRKKWRERNMTPSFEDHEELYGPAPSPVVSSEKILDTIELPIVHKREKLFQLLKKRRTTRTFDRRSSLSNRDFSILLYYAFGCHGFKKLSKTHTVLKKTSPSGGAMHPIEVYPIVSRVQGLDPGAYHYNVADHSLEMIRSISRTDIADITFRVLARQREISRSHVIFVLVARYGRHFWKYRSHKKAYKVVAMDAAHLSQTNYLICTQLGLGAYVTGAINDKYIEELLNLDGVNDGVVAACGAGIPSRHDPRMFDHKPFIPRKTVLTN